MFVTFSATVTNNQFVWYYSRVYLYLFISLFVYAVLNLFIAVIMDTYETIKVCDLLFHFYCLSSLYTFIIIKSNSGLKILTLSAVYTLYYHTEPFS